MPKKVAHIADVPKSNVYYHPTKKTAQDQKREQLAQREEQMKRYSFEKVPDGRVRKTYLVIDSRNDDTVAICHARHYARLVRDALNGDKK